MCSQTLKQKLVAVSSYLGAKNAKKLKSCWFFKGPCQPLHNPFGRYFGEQKAVGCQSFSES